MNDEYDLKISKITCKTNMKKRSTLVLSGGATGGISMLGVLSKLYANQYCSNLQKYVGTSIGSIIAYLLSVGISPMEMYDKLLSINLGDLFTDVSMLKSYGMKHIDKMFEILKDMTGHNSLTFADHYLKYKKTLIITGMNVSKNKGVLFSHMEYPDMDIYHALKISTAIPIFFPPVLYHDNYYIDGGCYMNYPISVCDINDTIGILIKFDDIDVEVKELKDYVILFVNCIGNLIKKNTYSYGSETIITKCSNFNDFDLDKDIIAVEFNLGIKSYMEYFSLN